MMQPKYYERTEVTRLIEQVELLTQRVVVLEATIRKQGMAMQGFAQVLENPSSYDVYERLRAVKAAMR